MIKQHHKRKETIMCAECETLFTLQEGPVCPSCGCSVVSFLSSWTPSMRSNPVNLIPGYHRDEIKCMRGNDGF